MVRGCRGKLKSRQFPDERAVYRSGASPVSAATFGFCSLHGHNPCRHHMSIPLSHLLYQATAEAGLTSLAIFKTSNGRPTGSC